MFFIGFNILSYPYLTTSHHKYWIYQIIYKAKPIKSVIKLYTDHDTLWFKHATHQKAESLRPTSPSNLDNMVNNSSLNTKYAEFSAKWWVLLQFHKPSCGYNQRCNPYQKTVPLLQSVSTSLFHPYLFTKSSLQSSLTLCSYITQQFFTSLSLRTTIPTIYTKNIFPTSKIFPIQAAWSDQGAREYCEDWHCFNLSILPQSMDSDSRAYSQSLILYRSDSLNWFIAGVANHPIHVLSYPQPIFITSIFN